MRYCKSILHYERINSKTVKIGDIFIGGNNEILLQSMTNTDTNNIKATAEQCIRICDAGGHLVRVTTQGNREAEKLTEIRKYLQEKGYQIPLVADVHFQPSAAEIAAQIIEKVRINPGNYTGKKSFGSDDDYFSEVRKNLRPLIEIAKKNNTAIRIGSNHGSLSERVLSKYGNTPEGMVMAALEFAKIFKEEDFHNLVISMKASDPRVMVYSARLLSAKMIEQGLIYPQHLGVTEAGEGEDGRIKSAIGIGTLLTDGIGDTIRVSLTEEPEYEISVAKKIRDYSISKASFMMEDSHQNPFNPFAFEKRRTDIVMNLGGENHPVVIADCRDLDKLDNNVLKSLGYEWNDQIKNWNIKDQAADYIWYEAEINFELPKTLKIINTSGNDEGILIVPLSNIEVAKNKDPFFVYLNEAQLTSEKLSILTKKRNFIILYESMKDESIGAIRQLYIELKKHNILAPVVQMKSYPDNNNEDLQIKSAIDFGPLLIDGLCDGIMISASNISTQVVNETAFGILQASKTRITKPEYISCPGCGRTLFELQKATAIIKKRTAHLKGVKIGIMGCIVNGPGEMADADYGYVGAGPGKITLYKKQEVVKRAIPEEDALNELIELIKVNGDWVDV